jgi:hypothetical protein
MIGIVQFDILDSKTLSYFYLWNLFDNTYVSQIEDMDQQSNNTQKSDLSEIENMSSLEAAGY